MAATEESVFHAGRRAVFRLTQPVEEFRRIVRRLAVVRGAGDQRCALAGQFPCEVIQRGQHGFEAVQLSLTRQRAGEILCRAEI